MEEFNSQFVGEMKIEGSYLNLHDRAKHVFSEALRVLQFRDCTLDKSPNMLPNLARLMNESQQSCKALYECSCPEIDTLVDCCLKAGALGSRLTGAGWGGCTVSLVQKDHVQYFVQEIKRTYYDKSLEFKASKLSFEDAVFWSEPGMGASAIEMNELF